MLGIDQIKEDGEKGLHVLVLGAGPRPPELQQLPENVLYGRLDDPRRGHRFDSIFVDLRLRQELMSDRGQHWVRASILTRLKPEVSVRWWGDGQQPYVLGFAFTPGREFVTLIRKRRPAWQEGRFNGVGGKLVPFEPPNAGMSREFREETGKNIPADDWNHYATLDCPDGLVYVFQVESSAVWSVCTTTDEDVSLLHVDGLPYESALTNIEWLIAMSHDAQAREHPLSVRYQNRLEVQAMLSPTAPGWNGAA